MRIISRDRGGDYAAAASFAAPQAEQIADRFHLLVNAGDVLERCLLRHHTSLRQAARALVPAEAPVRTTHRTPGEDHRKQERRGVRHERYEQVLQYLHAEYFPELATRPRQIDPSVAYLQQRWDAGEHHVPTLWREIRAQGYPGADVQIRRRVRAWRSPPRAPGAPGRPLPSRSEVIYYSVRKTRWLLVKAPTDLSAAEAAYVTLLKQLSPSLAEAQQLVMEFCLILTERSLDRLDSWLECCKQSGISELVGFARGIQHDYVAVQAAVRYDWSQGPVEGQVNRLKLLKRQMYGRAGFALLRRRVLAQSARPP